jgi:hypothetical protein
VVRLDDLDELLLAIDENAPRLLMSWATHWAYKNVISPLSAAGPEKGITTAILIVSPVGITGLPGSKSDMSDILLPSKKALTVSPFSTLAFFSTLAASAKQGW